jgi:hypothetical protein
MKTAFKETSKKYPNYGKKTDMGARQWWTEVCDTLLSDILFPARFSFLMMFKPAHFLLLYFLLFLLSPIPSHTSLPNDSALIERYAY